MNQDKIKIYGVSTASNDFNGVRPVADNNELFQAVVEYYGEVSDGWCKVKRIGVGNKFYEIISDCFHRKSNPKFLIGETVLVPKKMCTAIIHGIGWHFKKDEYVYTLEFNGVKISKRYFSNELEKVYNE